MAGKYLSYDGLLFLCQKIKNFITRNNATLKSELKKDILDGDSIVRSQFKIADDIIKSNLDDNFVNVEDMLRKMQSRLNEIQHVESSNINDLNGIIVNDINNMHVLELEI